MLTTASAFRPIHTNYSGWEEDLFNRVAQYEEQCPYYRDITYYFSDSGDDDNDGLSPNNPKQTIAAMQALIDADTTESIAISLERGSEWNTNVGLTVSRANTTICAHGVGNKPFFNFFTQKYSRNYGWVVASGSAYGIGETTNIQWLRLVGDRMGTGRGQPLSRQTSIGTVASEALSWWWDGATNLYVNLDGDDPDDYELEGCVSNMASGIAVSADGCRVQGIRVDGAGMSHTDDSPQTQCFSSFLSGTDCSLFVDCEGNFSGSHIMAHYLISGTGGRSCWVNCKANWPKYNASGGETALNSFSSAGGHETLFINCLGRHGTLPSADWSFSTLGARGNLCYAHTATNDLELFIAYKCKTTTDILPYFKPATVTNVPSYTVGDPTTAKAFIVKCEQPYNGSNLAGGMPVREGTLLYGNRMRWTYGAADQSVDSNIAGKFMAFNNDFEMDFALRLDGTGGWLYGANADYCELYNNRWHVKNADGTTADRFAFFLLNKTASGAGGSGTAPNAVAINNIFSTDSEDGDAYHVGFNNTVTGLVNNAYYGMEQLAGQELGWDADAGAVTPTLLPEEGLANADLLAAGSATFMLSHDIKGRRRTVGTPDIGPVDFSSQTIPDPVNYGTLDWEKLIYPVEHIVITGTPDVNVKSINNALVIGDGDLTPWDGA